MSTKRTGIQTCTLFLVYYFISAWVSVHYQFVCLIILKHMFAVTASGTVVAISSIVALMSLAEELRSA